MKRQKAGRAAWMTTMLAALAYCHPAIAGATVDEQQVAPVAPNVRYFVSPVGVHLVAVVPDEGGVKVLHDGVAGEHFDSVPGVPGVQHDELNIAIKPTSDSLASSIVFNADGTHFACAGMSGDDIVLALDGKETARINKNDFSVRGLYFTPAGDRLYYNTLARKSTPNGGNERHFVVDGKPGPALGSEPDVRFSRDGAHYAYAAVPLDDRNKKLLVIDGSEAPYVGESPIFTGDGAHLITLSPSVPPGRTTVQVDGKPAFDATRVTQVYVAPAGPRYAVVASADGQGSVLYVDGQSVPETEGVDEVYFSPDGKRYAARCKNKQSKQYIVLDGEKGQEYLGVTDATFSPDSATFVYVAMDVGKQMVVTNGQASSPYDTIVRKPFFSPDGKKLAYVAVAGGKVNVVVDGKAMLPTRNAMHVAFSPDGSHISWLDLQPALGKNTISIDGQDQSIPFAGTFSPSGVTQSEPPRVLFSDDGKQSAFVGMTPNRKRAIVLNKKIIPFTGVVTRGFFTPDGHHLIWLVMATPKYTLFVDGQEVLTWNHVPSLATPIDAANGNWQMNNEGILTFLKPTPDSVQRVRVTPGTDTSVETIAGE